MTDLVTTGTAYTELTSNESRALAFLEKEYGHRIFVNPQGLEPGFYSQPSLGYWLRRAYIGTANGQPILVDCTGDMDIPLFTL